MPRRAPWLLVPIGWVLLGFSPVLAGVWTLAHRDTDQLFAPMRARVVEALSRGRLPLWDPFQAGGRPLFAEGSHSVLHPVSLLAALLAPSSVDVLTVGYLVAAAAGMHLLARALGASGLAAAGSGIGFALSGYAASMTGNLTYLAGLSSLPWLLAAARVAGVGAPWGPVLAALATAAMLFSGDWQAAVVGLGLAALLAYDAGGWRGLGRAAGGSAAGILLAAVQVVPTMALLPSTTRALPIMDEDKVRWALAPLRLLEWTVPGLVRGSPDLLPTDAAGRPVEAPFAESVYLGAPLLLAAVIGAARAGSARERRTGLLLAGACGVLLWIALGHHLGARQVLDVVPVWNRFRYSEKLMAPLGLCLAALAALGVDAFAAGRLAPMLRRGLLAVGVAASGLAAALWLDAEAAATPAGRLVAEVGALHPGRLRAGLPHLVGGVALALAADRLEARARRAAVLALALAASVTLAFPFGGHLGNPAAHGAPSPLRLESDGPAPRLAHPADGVFLPEDEGDLVDLNAWHQSRLLTPAVNAASRVDTMGQYTPLASARYTTLAVALGELAGLHFRRYGVTHVVLPVPIDPLYERAAAFATGGGTFLQGGAAERYELWAVPHRPWAFFPSRALAAPGPEQALGTLYGLIVQGDDATVVVEAAAAPPVAPGRVLLAERAPEAVRIVAESAGPSLLVVQDSWWPGWKATIDGQPAPILAADAIVRAVPWPAGRHRLELVYDPPEVTAGLAASGVGALLLLALAARARGARRQER